MLPNQEQGGAERPRSCWHRLWPRADDTPPALQPDAKAGLPVRRYAQLGLSYAAYVALAYRTIRIFADFVEHPYARPVDAGLYLGTNIALGSAYLLLHPGTLGDYQVARAEQRPYLLGAAHSLHKEACAAFMRAYTNLNWVLLWLVIESNIGGSDQQARKLKAINRGLSSILSLGSFSTQVGSGTVRNYRANPLLEDPAGKRNDLLLTALMNFVTHMINSQVVSMIGINLLYAIRLREFDAVDADPVPNVLLPQACGIAITQSALTILFVCNRDTATARIILAGALRIAARMAMRVITVKQMSPTEIAITVCMEISDTAIFYRWFREPANRFIANLQMQEAHAQPFFGRQRTQAQVHRQRFRKVLNSLRRPFRGSQHTMNTLWAGHAAHSSPPPSPGPAPAEADFFTPAPVPSATGRTAAQAPRASRRGAVMLTTAPAARHGNGLGLGLFLASAAQERDEHEAPPSLLAGSRAPRAAADSGLGLGPPENIVSISIELDLENSRSDVSHYRVEDI